MADHDRIRIKPLDEKGDYSLWKIRIEAACKSKSLSEVLTRDTHAESSEDAAKFADKQNQASNIIVSALSDGPLRVVRTVIGNPYQMLVKLDARYDSKSTASRISRMSELVSLRYSTLKHDITKHIDKMTSLIVQLRNMKTNIEDALAVGILVASIEAPQLLPVTASIKTLSDDSISWESVTARLIEEYRILKVNMGPKDRAAVGVTSKHCEICNKKNHTTPQCFLNPLNPKNKLNLPKDVVPNTNSANHKRLDPDKRRADRREKKDKQRAAPARAMMRNNEPDDLMMLDSGTTAHMTPDVTYLQDTKDCTVPIALGDDSTVRATHNGTRPVVWKSRDGTKTTVTLSNTLAAPDLAMSLLSIPALTTKGICVLFMPEQALMIDMHDNYSIIGQALRADDGLFYISDRQDRTEYYGGETDKESVRAMMAIARSVNEEETSESDDDDPDDLPPLLEDDEDSDSEEESSETSDEERDDEEPLDNSDSDETVDLQTGIQQTQKVADTVDDAHSVLKANNSLHRCNKEIINIWHNRIGHAASTERVKGMIESGLLPSVKCNSNNCEECTKGKYRKRYAGSLTKARQVGHLHVDIKGPIKPLSEEGHRYFLNVVDEHSRLIYVKALKRKGDASAELLQFVKVFERQTGCRVKSLHTDGGGEFKRAAKSLRAKGVTVTQTTSYTPASNGLVERGNGIVLSLSRACLLQARIPLLFWNHAIEHVAQSKNMVVHSSTEQVPYTVLYGTEVPYVKHMRPFGCRVLYSPVSPRLPAFHTRLEEGICLGHEEGGIYTVLSKGGIIRTKHVKFYEYMFPGYSDITGDDRDSVSVDDDDSSFSGYTSDSDGEDESDLDGADVTLEETTEALQDGNEEHEQNNADLLTHYPAQTSTFRDDSDAPNESDDEPYENETGNSRRGRNNGTAAGEGSTNLDRPSDNLRPRQDVDYTFKAEPLPEGISTSDEPTVTQALNSPEASQWKNAISEEFDTLKKAQTWRKCNETIPPGTTVLPSGIILRLKRDDVGKPARFKGRLVARGNFQRTVGSAYTDRYAPVACIELVRLLLILSVAHDWTRQHVDIKGAFLYAQLPDTADIWMRLPRISGIGEADGRIVKLVKSLYGLRQAPKLWYEVLARTLQSLGFCRSTTSECLFIYTTTAGKVFLLAYVDDLLLVGNHDLVKRVKEKLGKLFVVTDLGECHFFLGVRLQATANGLFLSQPSFTQKIIDQANMLTAKPSQTPLPFTHSLYDARSPIPEEEKSVMEGIPYREVLGSLIYLSTRTRPDIATAVSMLGKFQADPGTKHWRCLKNVVRYLIGTQDHGILLKNERSQVTLEAWSDADWARDNDKRRSRSGYILLVNDSPIIWKSRLQTSTALSTAEAEFTALSSCIQDVKWLREVLEELGVQFEQPTIVYQDNLGSISWTEEVQGLRKVKHVGIKYHHVRDAVANKKVEVLYTPSAGNRADSFTKALVGSTFTQHRKWMGCYSENEVDTTRGGMST